AVAPTPLAPANATTVNDCRDVVESNVGVDVTVTSVSCSAAVAVQISAVPNWVLARLTSVQDRPAPDTLASCRVVVLGPSDATNASSTAPGASVLNGAVVRDATPSAKTTVSTLIPVAAGGPVETSMATAEPVVT